MRALIAVIVSASTIFAALMLVITGLWAGVAWFVQHEEYHWLSPDEVSVSGPAITFSKNAEVFIPDVLITNSNTLFLPVRVIMHLRSHPAHEESPGESRAEGLMSAIREHEAAVIFSFAFNFTLPREGKKIKAAHANAIFIEYTFIPTRVPEGTSPEIGLERETIVAWRLGQQRWLNVSYEGESISQPVESVHGTSAIGSAPSCISIIGGPQRWELVVGIGCSLSSAQPVKGDLGIDLRLEVKVGFVRRVVLGIDVGPSPGTISQLAPVSRSPEGPELLRANSARKSNAS